MALTLKEQAVRLIPSYSYQHYENLYTDAQALLDIPLVPVVSRQVFHDSVKVPGFRQLTKSQRRVLPVNNYEFTVAARPLDKGWKYTDRSDLWYTSTRSTARSILNGMNGGPGLSALSDPPLLDASQLTYVKSKIREKAQGVRVNYAQAFAERQQTARLLRDTMFRFANAYRWLRKGHVELAFKALRMEVDPVRVSSVKKKLFSGRVPPVTSPRARKALALLEPPGRISGRLTKKAEYGAASSAWLEMQYGWKPLLSDIYGSAELLAERMARQESVCTISHSSKRKAKIEHSLSHVMTGSSLGKVDEVSESKCRIVVDYKVSDEAAQILGKTGISNPALLAWELIPYSFVVDWFVGVGNYLESFTAFDGLTFRRGYVNQTALRRFRSTVQGSSGTYNLFYDDRYELELDVRNYHFKRTRLNGFSDLAADFPTLKNPFSSSHLASAVALLQMSFLNRKP